MARKRKYAVRLSQLPILTETGSPQLENGGGSLWASPTAMGYGRGEQREGAWPERGVGTPRFSFSLVVPVALRVEPGWPPRHTKSGNDREAPRSREVALATRHARQGGWHEAPSLGLEDVHASEAVVLPVQEKVGEPRPKLVDPFSRDELSGR